MLEDLMPVQEELIYSGDKVLTKEFLLFVVRKYQRSVNSAEFFDFYVKSNDENHFVQVRCQRKYEDSLELLIANLTSFVSDILNRLDQINEKNSVPTKVCNSMCSDNLKIQFNIPDTIKALQQKYFNIIKEFDATKSEEVSVTYWMRQLPKDCKLTDENHDWEYVKNIIEESMPHQIKYTLQLCGDIMREGIEESLIFQFNKKKENQNFLDRLKSDGIQIMITVINSMP